MSPAATKTITVGIVEDDTMLADMYSMKFTKEGFSVVHASDGEEALNMVSAKKPDILLLDIIMPKMDGFQVLKALRDKGEKLPVILLTNLGQEEDIQKGRALGATDYFVKSNFTPDAIVAKVRSVLKKS